jgi:hypothetical protein
VDQKVRRKNINNLEFEQLIEKGVEKLKKFGFVNVTRENIFSDEVYCFFLVRFTASLKGRTNKLDAQIDRFLNEIQKTT